MPADPALSSQLVKPDPRNGPALAGQALWEVMSCVCSSLRRWAIDATITKCVKVHVLLLLLPLEFTGKGFTCHLACFPPVMELPSTAVIAIIWRAIPNSQAGVSVSAVSLSRLHCRLYTLPWHHTTSMSVSDLSCQLQLHTQNATGCAVHSCPMCSNLSVSPRTMFSLPALVST